MRAYWTQIRDGQSVIGMRDTPIPVPAAHQLLVKTRAAALNRGEFIALHGLVGDSAAIRAGIEAAGDIADIGPDVDGFQTGTRVMGRVNGAYAEYALMDAREAIGLLAERDRERARSDLAAQLAETMQELEESDERHHRLADLCRQLAPEDGHGRA